MNACDDVTNQNPHDVSITTTSKTTRSTTTTDASSVATLQNINTSYDVENADNVCIKHDTNCNNNNKNKSTKLRASSTSRSEDSIPDHVLYIQFKHGEDRIYSAYFRREQRHQFLVIVFMTFSHAVTLIVLDIVPENDWDTDRLYRTMAITSLTLLVFVLYCVQRLVKIRETLKELVAILAWLLLCCQMIYASTTTIPRHLAADGLSWIGLLTFATQVTLPVGVWPAVAASFLLVCCHSTMAALRNQGESYLIFQVVSNSLVVLPCIVIGLSVSVFMDRLLRKSLLETKAVLNAKVKIEAAYQEKKSLLLSVLPSHVAEEMIQDVGELSDGQFRKIYMSRYENVSILFADIVGFTAISSSVSAAHLVQILNQLFGRFDVLANRYHQDRIKILGDCYYCVCGALTPRPDHAVLCIHMGLAVVDTISFVRHKTGKDVNMRVGVHTGACLGGVLGQRQWQFDVLGKEVTLANKMESGGIPARVHISEATRACLNEEFELEAGHGGDREEELRFKNVATYLVKSVLKPYPQGTLDDVMMTGKDVKPCTNTNDNTTTTTTTTTTIPVITTIAPPPSTTTTIENTNNTDSCSNNKHSNVTTHDNYLDTSTKQVVASSSSSSSSPSSSTIPVTAVAATTVDTSTPTAPTTTDTTTNKATPSLQTTTTNISTTSNTKQQQQQQQQQGEGHQPSLHIPIESSHKPQRSQSVKTSNHHHSNGVNHGSDVTTLNSEGIRRNAKTRTTIATTRVSDRLYRRRYSRDGKEEDEDDLEGGMSDIEEDRMMHELRLRRGWSDERVEMDLKKALEEKEANRSLGGQINLKTLSFRDVAMETRYKHRSQSYSGLPLVALCLAFSFMAGARFTILPRNSLAIISYILGQLVLILMAAVSMAPTYTKKFPDALVRFAVTIEHHGMARMLWGVSACAVFFLCDVIPIVECESTPLNTTLTSSPNLDTDTQHSVCRYVIYYPHTTTVTLFAVTSLVNAGHVMKVFVMKVVVLVQCLLYLVVFDQVLDNYDAVVYQGHTNYTSTKYRLVTQALAIAFVLDIYDRKMELLFRKLFLWKEESKKEKGKAMGLQRKNEALVFNLMPAHVAKDFIGTRVNKKGLYSKAYDETGVIFAACPNFHAFYNESAVNNNGLECLRFLNEIISDYDELLNQTRFSSIVKIKTVGPTYMAVSGMTESGLKPNDVTDRWAHLNDLVQFAFGLQDVLRKINEQSFNTFILRIGINHGPLIAGVIGATKPHYDVWGNTVNVASRMESTGQPGRIQVVEETKMILERFGYGFESRGLINVKGKGQLVTYFLDKADGFGNDVMPNQVPDS